MHLLLTQATEAQPAVAGVIQGEDKPKLQLQQRTHFMLATDNLRISQGTKAHLLLSSWLETDFAAQAPCLNGTVCLVGSCQRQVQVLGIDN